MAASAQGPAVPRRDRHRPAEVRHLSQYQPQKLALEILEALSAVTRNAKPAVLGRRPKSRGRLSSGPESPAGPRASPGARVGLSVRRPQHDRQVGGGGGGERATVTLCLDFIAAAPQTGRVLHHNPHAPKIDLGLNDVAGGSRTEERRWPALLPLNN